MGRASNAKKLRRVQLARAGEEPPKSKGGRPRIYSDDTARYRAYRLRKKAGLVGVAPVATTDTEHDQVVEVGWSDSPEYLVWLAECAHHLGPEWLDTQLELDAEIILAERELA
jgi:hypothetical protein